MTKNRGIPERKIQKTPLRYPIPRQYLYLFIYFINRVWETNNDEKDKNLIRIGSPKQQAVQVQNEIKSLFKKTHSQLPTLNGIDKKQGLESAANFVKNQVFSYKHHKIIVIIRKR